jgi:2-polyprenyl-6-methoxyphenol hydroxylase-like FAD-dependent oxidoreductase
MTNKDEEKIEDGSSTPRIIIAGGGIAGLVLALAIQRHCKVTPEVFEQSSGFQNGVGGAIGMYPNGLRVIRDLDDDDHENKSLLKSLVELGYPYIYRRWYRHDGTEVACGKESKLLERNGGKENEKQSDLLSSIGIRRYKLQNALYETVCQGNIPVTFSKRILSVVEEENSKKVKVIFADGSVEMADFVFGADGVKSKVRDAVVSTVQDPEYTGVTCWMGAAPNVSRPVRGICFPSSSTTKCHMCTYPTSDTETIFQIYFPTPIENPESWGKLTEDEGRAQAQTLADQLQADGWDDQFVQPIRNADPASLVRTGLRAREPVNEWYKGRIGLLGDAAHPPVPYIGQGAMMAIEDAGTIGLLLKHYCCSSSNKENAVDFSMDNFTKAMHHYQQIRRPRTHAILGSSHTLGKTQQKRAENKLYNFMREINIKFQVLIHGTLPIMLPGATYDYKAALDQSFGQKQELKQ